MRNPGKYNEAGNDKEWRDADLAEWVERGIIAGSVLAVLMAMGFIAYLLAMPHACFP